MNPEHDQLKEACLDALREWSRAMDVEPLDPVAFARAYLKLKPYADTLLAYEQTLAE